MHIVHLIFLVSFKGYGTILYRTKLQRTCSMCKLNITGVRDRAYVFVDNVSYKKSASMLCK